MIDPAAFRPELLGHEYRAVARLCGRWASKIHDGNHRDWEAKAELLRSAVFVGIGTGGAESVPHELVFEEYCATYAAFRCAMDLHKVRRLDRRGLERVLSSGEIEYQFGETSVLRPFPACERIADDVLSDRQGLTLKPSYAAFALVGERLGIRPDTVRKLSGKQPRRSQEAVTAASALLASIYLDLCSVDRGWLGDLRDLAFAALEESQYSGIRLFYLVLLAHNTPVPLVRATVEPEMLERLCTLVRSGSVLRPPFWPDQPERRGVDLD